MHVAPNAKFAAFFLSRCDVAGTLPEYDMEVDPGVWAGRRLGIDTAGHWREWLGSLALDEMNEGGLAVYVTAAAQHPEVLDGENEALKTRADDLINGLMLQGVPTFAQGFSMTGAHVGGEIRIRQQGKLRHVEPTWGLQGTFLVGVRELKRAVWLAQRLRCLQDEKREEWGRLLRATRTLLEANRESNEHGERLHQFVRSVDALVKAPPGENRRKFCHRGQTFVIPSAPARAVLAELYDVRSAVEHLNVPTEPVPGSTKAQQIVLVNQRTRQADALARFSILRILESARMFNTFRTDDEIDSFWRLPDDMRASLFGSRLDILAIR